MRHLAYVKTDEAAAAQGAERERIVHEFAPVIKAMAHRLAFRLPACLDTEDLISAGVIGLMNAMEKYDPTREATFKTYAEFRIRGAMLDEIRAMNWVPRSVHERIGLLKKTQAELLKRYGRPPTDEEVAGELKMSPSELDAFLSCSQSAVLLSLQDLGVQGSDGPNLLRALVDTQHPDPLSLAVSENIRETVVQAIQQLPEKERLVLTLYYYEELTMKEIGTVLKLTESRICQIHAKAILRLKARLHALLEPA